MGNSLPGAGRALDPWARSQGGAQPRVGVLEGDGAGWGTGQSLSRDVSGVLCSPPDGRVRGAADALGPTPPAALPSRALLCSCSEAPAAQSPLERHRPAARAVSGITRAGSWNETGSDSCFHEGYEVSEVSARRAPAPPLCSLLFGTGVSGLSLPWGGLWGWAPGRQALSAPCGLVAEHGDVGRGSSTCAQAESC